MTTAEALLAAVIATPDDDLVRLVYADYLEETGDPERGELIRVQCELARLPEWDRLAAELRHRERLLLARHGRRWHAELPTLNGVTWGAFRRGFVAEIGVPDCDVLVRSADRLIAATPLRTVSLRDLPPRPLNAPSLPWLTGLRLTDRVGFEADRLERLLDSPLAERLTALNLRRVGDRTAVAVVVGLAGLTRLTRLDLTDCGIGDAEIWDMGTSGHLARLESLSLDDNDYYPAGEGITDDGAECFATARTFARLSALSLAGNGLTTTGVRRLLTSRTLTSLERLNLASNGAITAEAFATTVGPARWKSLDLTRIPSRTGQRQSLAALARCPQLSRLERLTLSHGSAADGGMAAFAASPPAATLRDLRVRDTYLSATAVADLAAGHWPRLHRLDFERVSMGAGGTRHLAEAVGFPALRTLRLQACDLEPAEAHRLATAPWASGLRHLDLHGNRLPPAVGHALAASPALRELRVLKLAANAFDASAVMALCAADLPELSEFDLAFTPGTGDAAAEGLATAGRMGRLGELNLSHTGLTAAGVARLADLPGPDLTKLVLGGNRIGDAAVAALVAADWPALIDLVVYHCGLTAAGMTALATAPSLARLRMLAVAGNEIPTAGPAAAAYTNSMWLFRDNPLWLQMLDENDGDI